MSMTEQLITPVIRYKKLHLSGDVVGAEMSVVFHTHLVATPGIN
jgi:hypothetical protein